MEIFEELKSKVVELHSKVDDFKTNHSTISVAVTKIIESLPSPFDTFGGMLWDGLEQKDESAQELLDILQRIEKNDEISFMEITVNIKKIMETNPTKQDILQISKQIKDSEKSIIDVIGEQIKQLGDIQTTARKIDNTVTKIEEISKINEEHRKKWMNSVYRQCKINLEFIARQMPRIDQCRANLLEKDSHEDRLYLNIDTKKVDHCISKLKSILLQNHGIMDPDISERIENNVKHIELYKNDKHSAKMFTNNPENKNKLIENIQFVLNMMNTQLDKNRTR